MTSEYLLDASPKERQRLLEQTDAFRPEAEFLLDACGLRTGQRALDVGCGPLGVMHLMADRVGPTGEVVGLDGDADMVSAARNTLAQRGLHNVMVIHARAEDSGQAPASFDLAHSRLLLVNVSDPDAVVREMAALVRPGGFVALQDIDWVSRICEPPHPAWDTVMRVVGDLWRRDGMDPCVGRRLPGLLARVGLRDIGVHATTRVFQRGHPYQTLMVERAEHCREALVSHGLITEAALEECLTALRAHLDDDNTIVLHGTFFQAWGRVPGDRLTAEAPA